MSILARLFSVNVLVRDWIGPGVFCLNLDLLAIHVSSSISSQYCRTLMMLEELLFITR